MGVGRTYHLVGSLRESLEEDHAADAAIDAVVRRGLFKPRGRVQFDLDRVMGTLDEFRVWLEDFSRVQKYGPHEWLIKRLERALAGAKRRARLTVRGRMTLRVLEKL